MNKGGTTGPRENMKRTIVIALFSAAINDEIDAGVAFEAAVSCSNVTHRLNYLLRYVSKGIFGRLCEVRRNDKV